ncbi:MAG: hypothetical protein ACFFF9_07100 [Candidatus Thorarchaeota archaeon]
MLVKNDSEYETLDHMLKLLRIDVRKLLAKLDQSESLNIEDELLEDEKWLASKDEYEIFGFIRSLALIATKLQPETFEETKNSLTEFWKDVISEGDWEDYEKEVPDKVKDF